MKKISIVLALAAICSAVVPSGMFAQTPAAPASALLYEITGPGIKEPSYLFGTIHMICSADMFPAERFNTYFGKTKQLFLEFDMDDPSVLQAAMAGSLLKDGKSVKDLVAVEEYTKIDATFTDYLGMSFDALQRFKPMVSNTYLLTSPKVIGCQPPVVYDNHLAQSAAGKKIPVFGLETVDDQIAVLDSVPLDKQLKDLIKTAGDPSKDAAEFKALYKAYLGQDSDKLYLLARDGMKAQDYSEEKMLDGRNAKWIPAIEKAVRSMPTFIAVGGGHLGGKRGVVALLRAKGFKLTPIRLNA